jgi:hypothetical protein
LVFGVTSGALAQERHGNGLELSAGLGAHFGGDVNVDPPDRDFEVDEGFYGKLTFDFFPIQYLGLGVYASFATSEHEFTGDINMAEVGLGIKPRVPVMDAIGSADLLITPGLSIGYRGLFTDELDDSDGLGINLGLDLRLRWDRIAVFIEPGILSQVAGGNSDADVTFAPVIGYAIAGVGVNF